MINRIISASSIQTSNNVIRSIISLIQNTFSEIYTTIIGNPDWIVDILLPIVIPIAELSKLFGYDLFTNL